MSLFIGMLAFENTGSDAAIGIDRLGILVGSLLSALVGYAVLSVVLPKGALPRRLRRTADGARSNTASTRTSPARGPTRQPPRAR